VDGGRLRQLRGVDRRAALQLFRPSRRGVRGALSRRGLTQLQLDDLVAAGAEGAHLVASAKAQNPIRLRDALHFPAPVRTFAVCKRAIFSSAFFSPPPGCSSIRTGSSIAF